MNDQIIEYYVHFINGERIKEPIQRLYVLEYYLRSKPISNLRKIVFWIACRKNPHYPYEGRTISLVRKGDQFEVVFYYWYDRRGYRVEYSKEHKKIDLQCLLNTISETSLPSRINLPYQ